MGVVAGRHRGVVQAAQPGQLAARFAAGNEDARLEKPVADTGQAFVLSGDGDFRAADGEVKPGAACCGQRGFEGGFHAASSTR